MFKFVGVYMDSDCVKCFFVYRGCVGIIDLGQVGDIWNR